MPGQWLSDTQDVVSGLSHGLYYADGQMQDGTQLRLVQAEQDVCGGRHLQ